MWVLTCKGTMFTKKVVTATGLYQAIGKGCNKNKSSMSLNKMRQNLTKTTAVAAVIGVATCLFPAIAQAQVTSDQPQVVTPSPEPPPLQASGRSRIDTDVTVDFSLKNSVQDTEPDLNVGEFPGAIQDFRDSGNPNTNVTPLQDLPPGNLTASKLTTDPTTGNFSGLRIGYDDITNNNFPFAAFNNDGLRYDVTFPDSPATLTLFIPSNDSRLINSLSDFTDFLRSTDNTIQGVVSRSDLQVEEAFIVTNEPSRRGFRFATVPEPTATASLLGVGALGAISLLKRNKRLRKSV
ncbi:hypothetical protein NIES4073_34130 [Kalymmatonema gypsitolerans NIES-4073]|nr:hypothetical protein NIES4073_34130 [Scytonema sp. NIES-4073]